MEEVRGELQRTGGAQSQEQEVIQPGGGELALEEKPPNAAAQDKGEH
jgi:hypothetical protein